MRFRDRKQAGQELARTLEVYKNHPSIIYALPRGGVALGVQVAKWLRAPLDLIIPRKIGHPHHAEYGVCAVTEDGHLVCNQAEITRLDAQWLKIAIKKQQAEARRRRLLYLGDGPELSAQGRVAIIVDDGIATGLSMLAAIQEVKDRLPTHIVLAVPVAPREVIRQLENYVDAVVALTIPDAFMGAVGAYYDDFNQLTDNDVVTLLGGMQIRPSKRVHGKSV